MYSANERRKQHGPEKNRFVSEKITKRKRHHARSICRRIECIGKNGFPMGDRSFPNLKILHHKLTLTRYLQKQYMDMENKKYCLHPFWRCGRYFLYFRDEDVEAAWSVLYPRTGNEGGIQRGQSPTLAHGLCLQSLVCYTLCLRGMRKAGVRNFGRRFWSRRKELDFGARDKHRNEALLIADRWYIIRYIKHGGPGKYSLKMK